MIIVKFRIDLIEFILNRNLSRFLPFKVDGSTFCIRWSYFLHVDIVILLVLRQLLLNYSSVSPSTQISHTIFRFRKVLNITHIRRNSIESHRLIFQDLHIILEKHLLILLGDLIFLGSPVWIQRLGFHGIFMALMIWKNVCFLF